MSEQREFLVNNFYRDGITPETKWHEYESIIADWKVLPITDELGRQALLAIRLSMTGKIDSYSLPVVETEQAGYVVVNGHSSLDDVCEDVQFQVDSGLYLANEDEHASLLDELVRCVMLENEINAI